MIHSTVLCLALGASLLATPARIAAYADTLADADAAERAAVVADIDAAMARWEASCRTHGGKGAIEGLCVEIAAPPAAPAKGRCAAPRLGTVKVIARRKSAKKAQADLAAALERAADLAPPTDATDKAAYVGALGRAHLATADADLEAFLRLTMPGNLDFFVEEWKKDSGIPKYQAQYEKQVAKKKDSEKRFRAFFEAAVEGGQELAKAHAKSKSFGDADLVIDAALRTAVASQHFADQLRTAPVPKSARTDEIRDAYCDALADQVEPPEKMARDAALFCVERADASGVTGDSVAACKDLLARYPAPTK